MTINRERVALISEWAENCSAAVMADFIADKFLKDQLTAAAKLKLLALLKSYYGLASLDSDALRTLLVDDNYYNQPNHRQEIIGNALRDYLNGQGVVAEQGSRQLSYAAFVPIANDYGFNVQFYAEEVDDANKTNRVIKPLIDDQNFSNVHVPGAQLTLDVVWHNSKDIANASADIKRDYHFDRIMQDASAAKTHNDILDKQVRSFGLSNAGAARQLSRDDAVQMRHEVQVAVNEINAMIAREDKGDAPPPAKRARIETEAEKQTRIRVSVAAMEKTLRETHHVDANAKKWDQLIQEAGQAPVDVSVAAVPGDKVAYHVGNNKVIVVTKAEQERLDAQLAAEMQADELKKPRI